MSEQIGQKILDVLRDHPELNKKEYQGKPFPTGFCYVASEAYYHLVGGKPHTIRHEGSVHWYLVVQCASGQVNIVDLTADQFETPVPYHLGVGRGFLTKKPSKRTQVVIEEVNGR